MLCVLFLQSCAHEKKWVDTEGVEVGPGLEIEGMEPKEYEQHKKCLKEEKECPEEGEAK